MLTPSVLIIFIFFSRMQVFAGEFDDVLKAARIIYRNQTEKLQKLNETYMDIYRHIYSDYVTLNEESNAATDVLVSRLQYCAYMQNKTVPITNIKEIFNCSSTTKGDSIITTQIRDLNATLNNAIATAAKSFQNCKPTAGDSVAIKCFQGLRNEYDTQYQAIEKKASEILIHTNRLRVADQQTLTACITTARGRLISSFEKAGLDTGICL